MRWICHGDAIMKVPEEDNSDGWIEFVKTQGSFVNEGSRFEHAEERDGSSGVKNKT